MSVFDVALFILESLGAMSTMKLQKLVYYCQAWSLVWDEKPIYNEKIEAWVNGPVIPALFEYHKRRYCVNSHFMSRKGNVELLTSEQIETISAVLEFYGDMNPQELIDLTHKERPWLEARGKLYPNEKGRAIISHRMLANYYSSI